MGWQIATPSLRLCCLLVKIRVQLQFGKLLIGHRTELRYDSIQSKTNRRAVPRMLYRMLFVKPVLDTTMNGRVLDESRLLEPYAGKTVGVNVITWKEPMRKF